LGPAATCSAIHQSRNNGVIGQSSGCARCMDRWQGGQGGLKERSEAWEVLGEQVIRPSGRLPPGWV
jgi:hypothetical protein